MSNLQFTNSSLVEYTRLSPNYNSPRKDMDNPNPETRRTYTADDLCRITPHMVVGQLSVESLGAIFANPKREASSNYGIGYDGKKALYVEEKNRSWCSSSPNNDNKAITIECASDKTSPYAFNAKVFNSLIELCVDICKRYNKTKLLWINNRTNALAYKPAPNEMILTVHCWFANTPCPGDWLMGRMNELAEKVTAKLANGKGTLMYRVQIGAFKVKENANNMLERAKLAGFRDAYITEDNGYYKVQIGSYKLLENAKKQQQLAISKGFKSAYIVKAYV